MDDTKRVGRSLIVLLAALVLVYVVFFDVRGNNIPSPNDPWLSGADIDRMLYIDTTNQVSNNNNSDDIYYPSFYKDTPDLTVTAPEKELMQAQNIEKEPLVVDTSTINTTNTQDDLPWVVEDFEWRRFYSTDFLFGKSSEPTDTVLQGTQANPVWVNAWVSNTTITQQPAQVQIAPNQPQNTTPSTSDSTLNLANTWVRDGMLDIIKKLELDDDTKYILKDINNTHYAYLGSRAWDISQITSLLWWTSIDITDSISIQNNQLFGVEVSKITIPSYKRNLKELMIITFANGDAWFLQIDKDYYNQLQNKLYIKQLFEPYY